MARNVHATAKTREFYTDFANADVGTPLPVGRFKMRARLEDT